MINAGILVISSGEYSDYGIIGLFRVKKPFDIKAARQECIAEAQGLLDPLDKVTVSDVSPYKLAAWLIQNGYLEELSYEEENLS